MKDRMFLVQHDNKLYGFATDKTKEMIDFAVKKLGGKLRKESKAVIGKIIDNPESVWSLGANQPYITLNGEGSGYLNIFLTHDGLQAK